MRGSRTETAAQRTILLVSPSLQGHRLTYCRVLSAVLTAMGHRVVVAGNLSDDSILSRPLLADLGRRRDVELLDMGSAVDVTRDTLPQLVTASEADVVFLAEADSLLDVLSGERRLAGRVVALFLRSTNYQYLPPRQWWRGSRARLLRRVASAPYAADADFHERGLIRNPLVDAALVLDERSAARHPQTHRWMPDIYREFGAAAGDDRDETFRWSSILGEFLAGAGSRPVIAYVGTNRERRGYDTLLRLALSEDACFIHCGRLIEPDGADAAAVPELRAALAQRGALLETAAPYTRPETAELFLRAAPCVVLPYRQHLGSSGVMLQALAAGRPVLVPDCGLMAYRARSFGVGATYCADDAADLRREFRAAQARRAEACAARLGAFMASFSATQLEAAVAAAVTGRGPGATLPQARLGQAADAAGEQA